LDPSYVRGYVRLGQALLALGDKGDVGDAPTLRRAKRALEKALELDPSNATAMKCAKEVGMSIQLHCDSDEDED
jgi:cytochrome c-type biogenesis protein CcmH/NrfG